MDHTLLSVAEIEDYYAENNCKYFDCDISEKFVSQLGASSLKRPNEFLHNCVLFSCVHPKNIKHGVLSRSNYWLLCAIATLAEFPYLIYRMFENKFVSACGVYKIRLCKNGQWQTVIIDDTFPWTAENEPIFSMSYNNDLWVSLIEKAYAKLHGNYISIKTGLMYEALVDLTGAPYERVLFHSSDSRFFKCQAGNHVTLVFEMIGQYLKEGYLLSVSTPIIEDINSMVDDTGMTILPSGLLAGCSYTILNTYQTSSGHNILQLRDPWTIGGWIGDWSHVSLLWTEELLLEVESIKAESKEDSGDTKLDGIFWMSDQDLLKVFVELNIFFIHKEYTKPWIDQRRKSTVFFNGQKMRTVSFQRLSVRYTSTMYIGLHQRDCRIFSSSTREQTYIDIGISIFKQLAGDKYELVMASGLSMERQNQIAVTLEAGEYVLVPVSTGSPLALEYDLKETRMEGVEMSICGADGTLTSAAIEVFDEIFCRLDEDLDGLLTMTEFNNYMLLSGQKPYTKILFEDLLSHYDCQNECLTIDGFRDVCVERFHQLGSSYRDLFALGYDSTLSNVFARSLMISVHSDQIFSLIPQVFDESLYEKAITDPIYTYGSVTEYAHGKVKLYVQKGGVFGVSMAVENLFPFTLRIIMDCSNSVNVVSHRHSLIADEVLDPKCVRTMHHLFPKESGPWGWHKKLSIQKV